MASAMAPFEVMIVDDEPADVLLLRMALGQAGYACNVTTAGNGAEALEKLRECAKAHRPGPDLILLDLNMPQMSGHEFLQKARQEPGVRLPPVVVVSTSDAERDVSAAYASGASGYLPKPVDIDELFVAVKRIEDYWFGAMRRPAQL